VGRTPEYRSPTPHGPEAGTRATLSAPHLQEHDSLKSSSHRVIRSFLGARLPRQPLSRQSLPAAHNIQPCGPRHRSDSYGPVRTGHAAVPGAAGNRPIGRAPNVVGHRGAAGRWPRHARSALALPKQPDARVVEPDRAVDLHHALGHHPAARAGNPRSIAGACPNRKATDSGKGFGLV